jgi:hypothetical protein
LFPTDTRGLEPFYMEVCYWALFFMPVVVVISHFLNVFVQLANKRGLKKIFYMPHMFCEYAIYTRPLSAQAQYSRSCHIICSLCYNSSLDTWTWTPWKHCSPIVVTLDTCVLIALIQGNVLAMLMSCHQNAREYHNIKIAKRSIENVAQLKNLGMTIINQNLTQEEIKRLNSGNAWYHLVENLIYYCVLSKT